MTSKDDIAKKIQRYLFENFKVIIFPDKKGQETSKNIVIYYGFILEESMNIETIKSHLQEAFIHEGYTPTGTSSNTVLSFKKDDSKIILGVTVSEIKFGHILFTELNNVSATQQVLIDSD